MKDIKVLLVSTNYPNKFYNWAPWNKEANVAISKNTNTEVVAPLPYSMHFKFVPYHQLSTIPIKENSIEGIVHRPRFLYLLPKRIFYGFEGSLYERSVSKYVSKNVEKPNLIHCHHIYPDGYAMMNLCKTWSIPLITDLHSISSLSNWMSNNKIKPKIKETLNFSSKIICISDQLCDLLLKMGVNEKKIEHIPLGVDINKFKPFNNEKIKGELKVSNERIILFVGRLDKLKGVHILLKALSLSTFKNFKLLIVGDGLEKNNLIELSKKLRLDHAVVFFGELKGKKLFELYSLADLFVLPSLTEGRPVVIYEAMASECAIIASNVGGIPEQVKDGYNGFLVEPSNPNQLSNKITYLLKNKDLIEKMGENGRKRIIEEGWTWKGYGEKIVQIYKNL